MAPAVPHNHQRSPVRRMMAYSPATASAMTTVSTPRLNKASPNHALRPITHPGGALATQHHGCDGQPQQKIPQLQPGGAFKAGVGTRHGFGRQPRQASSTGRMLKPFALSALAALAAATGASDEAARAAAGPKTTAINMATTANTVISAQWNGFIGWLP
jgi:hypothetical protein